MIKTGFIKKIGVPRDWQTKEGEKRQTYPVTVAIPYVRQDGKQGEDLLVCDHICANPDYVKQLNELGIPAVYSASKGTAHEWLTWRRGLNEFIPHLFKK